MVLMFDKIPSSYSASLHGEKYLINFEFDFESTKWMNIDSLRMKFTLP